jgi:DNA-binding PadR family transcriptional regulator
MSSDDIKEMPMDQSIIHPNDIPLSESTFLIMLSISSEPRHGYAIIKEVESMSDGRVKLSTGTLYGAIKRLLQNHWIERVDETEERKPQSKRFRKAYRLSAKGQKILVGELARMRTLISLANQRTQGAQT